jgi:hypothetical protein
MSRKVVSALFSAAVLGGGMLTLAAIATPKFGNIGAGRDGYALRENLRDLQAALLAYDAAHHVLVAAPPCPAGTPEPSFCPPPLDTPFGWAPRDDASGHGRYWVEVQGDTFTAHAQSGDAHYAVGATGEPEKVY